jgi:hypothetical protein
LHCITSIRFNGVDHFLHVLAVVSEASASSTIATLHHVVGEESLSCLSVVVEAGEGAAGAAIFTSAATTGTLNHSAVAQLNATSSTELEKKRKHFRVLLLMHNLVK